MDEALELLKEAGDQGMTVGEIAAMLDVPESTARRHVAQLVRARQAKRPTPRSPIYAVGVRPRKRSSAPKQKPRTPASAPSTPSRAEMALETMERHPEGVAHLFGMGIGTVEGLAMIANRISPRFRAFLQGHASRWPVTDQAMQAAGQSQAAAAWGRFYDKATAEGLKVEFHEMSRSLDEETLYELSAEAQAQDPPNLELMKLAVGELNRRAAKERQTQRQRRGGPPTPVQRPDLRVVTPEAPPANGGQLTTIPVSLLEHYQPATVPTQRETLTRAWGMPATGPLWPSPPAELHAEALDRAQADRRPGVALLTRRRVFPPVTPQWRANELRVSRGFQWNRSQAIFKQQQKEAEQVASDRQLVTAANTEAQQAQDRVDELKRSLRPAWLTSRKPLTPAERAQVQQDLAYWREVLELAQQRVISFQP